MKLPFPKVEFILMVYDPASKVSPTGVKSLLGKVMVLLATPAELAAPKVISVVKASPVGDTTATLAPLELPGDVPVEETVMVTLSPSCTALGDALAR